MSEIQRFEKQRHPVQILGAREITAMPNPQVLDRNTKQEQKQPEIHVHYDEVLPEDRIRIDKLDPDAPQLRLRTSDRKAWEKVKRGED